ncbi:MAG: ROK family protein [Chloroflexi bacterium]|nr:ROK family protein [Chloroflexota bacterium]
MTTHDLIVAIDLGGTNLRVALMDGHARMLDRDHQLTRAEDGPERVADRIVEMARRMLAKQGVNMPLAVGAALASPIDLDGVMYRPPNLDHWQVVPFGALLTERFGVPVFAQNDATLAALGEHYFGDGKGVDDLIYLTVSTGVGGGIVAGGKLVLGERGLAGELGHILIADGGSRGLCGHAGCLESLVCGKAIVRRAIEVLQTGRPSALKRYLGNEGAMQTVDVFTAAAQGDALAQGVVDAVARDLGRGIVSLVHVFNPRRFILGGGVMNNWQALEQVTRATVAEFAMPGFLDHLSISLTRFGDDVGLVGATAYALQRLGRRPV